jgi:uncharacterized membrane protein
MVRLTFVFATLLIVLGLVAYFGLSGDDKSPTALIPAFAGGLFAILGVVGLKPNLRKHAMHAAMLLAVLGIAGTFSGVMKLPALFTDAESLERPTAVAVQAIMCGLCVVYLLLGIGSFVAARRGGAEKGG